jgi:RNA recognition motif-containing protein
MTDGNGQQGVMNTKLYVGNLSPAVSEADLRGLFSRAGTVTEVTMALDIVTQRSRGFGYVTMAAPELAAAALRDFHGYDLGGRHITVTEARPPQEPKGLMSDGFNFDSSAGFRPDRSNEKKRRSSTRSSRRRGSGR